MRISTIICIAAGVLFAGPALASQCDRPSVLRNIKMEMIDKSVMGYSRRCACPYHIKRNGERCGKKSGYSRAGGSKIYCYVDEISFDEARKYCRKSYE